MAMNPRLMRPLAKTPPGTPASLLLRFNGADESTDFIDSSPSKLTVTANGDAQISTAQSKFGGASGLFDGNEDYLTIDGGNWKEFGDGDFTIECWVYLNNDYSRNYIFGPGTDTASHYQGVGFEVQLTTLSMWASSDGASWDLVESDSAEGKGSIPVPVGEWVHVAMTRNAGTFRSFVNGQLACTVSGKSGSVYSAPSNPINIGRSGYLGGVFFFDGRIDDLRITKGLAVYTGPFIPPTQQLSAYATPKPIEAQASLLLHFDGDNESTVFTDSSVNALAVTANGGAQISTAESKFGGASVDLIAFRYVSIAPPPGFSLGTAPWTVEAWTYMRSLSPYSCLLEIGNHGSAGVLFRIGPDGLKVYSGGDYGSGASVSLNQWHHVAASFDGLLLKLFVDGIEAWSGAFSVNLSDGTSISIGHPLGLAGGPPDGSNANYDFDGYIDDLRITKGLAVYDGDFVVPAAQLPASASPYTTYKPYGTFLFSECVSGDLVGTYADGVGGRYTEVISVGSC